jgi:phosphoglycerate dehydrogenase-like enzyme
LPPTPYTVLFADPLKEIDQTLVASEAIRLGVTLQIADDEGAFRNLLPAANAVVTQHTSLNATDVAAAPSLGLIEVVEFGQAEVDRMAAAERGIAVVELANLGLLGVAEHTILLMLALTKELPTAHARTVAGERAPGVTEIRTSAREINYNWLGQQGLGWLYRKRLGIIGLGRIGRTVAVRARAFGMRVLYTSRHRLDARTEDDLGVEYAPLAELLARSDFVTLHTRLTPENELMFGAAELAKMQPTAYFVNTARGGLVDEAALIEALTTRRIAGAGLDVFEYEPIQRDNPLLYLDNVVLTPHIAGVYDPDARRAQLLEAFEHIESDLARKKDAR